jgi:hypothetical protein
VLLHPNPVFLSIESRMGEPAQLWCYSIESWEIFKQFEYFFSKDLSIDKRIMVLWSRLDKTTKQH